MENEFEKSIKKRNSKKILKNCPFAKVEVFERLCESDNFNVDDAIKQLDDEFGVYFGEIKSYVTDINEIEWGIEFINELEQDIKFLADKLTEMVRNQLNFEKSNDLVFNSIQLQQGKLQSVKVNRENKIEKQVTYAISTACKSFILALNDLKTNFRHTVQIVPLLDSSAKHPGKRIENNHDKNGLDINFIYKNHNQTIELACQEWFFYTIFSDYDNFDNKPECWKTIRLPKNSDLEEQTAKDEVNALLSKEIKPYFNDIEVHVKANPLKFKKIDLLEHLTRELIYQRDIDLYHTLQGQVKDFILPDKLPEFEECYQKSIYPLMLYNEQYSEIVHILQGWFNSIIDGLNILRTEIDPNWKPQINSLSIPNYNELYDDEDLPTEQQKLIQPQPGNLISEISMPIAQEFKDNNDSYKVWMLHKLGVLEKLKVDYLEKNPNSKNEDFAKLIHNLIGSNKKIDSIKRYITAAIKNEDIPTVKLRDQINKTLKEHNLE